MSASDNEYKGDKVSIVTTITDSIIQGAEIVPIAGKMVTLFKASNSARSALFERKVAAYWGAFQNPEIDKVLLANVYTNFRAEYGADYFDEALFNAIEKSDSVKRTKMISKLLILCSTNEIPKSYFWPVLQALQNLLINDLKFYSTHHEEKFENIVNPGFLGRSQSLGLLIFTIPTGAGNMGNSDPNYQLDDKLSKYVGKCARPYFK